MKRMETEVIIPGIACVLMAGGQFRVDMFSMFCVLQIVRKGERERRDPDTAHCADELQWTQSVGTVVSMDSCGSCQF